MGGDYTSTGIAGADKILGEKGIPRGHSILVAGGPGSGKTTFAMQFLYKGVTQYNEPGIYISLDEDPEDVKKNMSKFGWDLGKLEQEKKLAFKKETLPDFLSPPANCSILCAQDSASVSSLVLISDRSCLVRSPAAFLISFLKLLDCISL
jgi:RecA/RadA recombinase